MRADCHAVALPLFMPTDCGSFEHHAHLLKRTHPLVGGNVRSVGSGQTDRTLSPAQARQRSSVRLFVRFFVRSFVRSFVRVFVRLFVGCMPPAFSVLGSATALTARIAHTVLSGR